MTPEEMEQLTMRLTDGWSHATALRVLIGLAGLLAVVLTVRAMWKRDCTVLGALIWLAIGAVMMAFALVPERIIIGVASTEYMTRIRVIVGGLSLFVLLTTLESIRRTHLQERYALLWVATALVILAAALFPQAVELFRAVTGMTYASAMLAVAFTFLVLVAFHFSISISGMQSRHARLTQRIAVLEQRIKALERSEDTPDKP